MQFFLASYRYEIFIEVDAWRQVYYPVRALIEAASVQATKSDKKRQKMHESVKSICIFNICNGGFNDYRFVSKWPRE